ncbi:flagellar basal-body MS-ring/collar protein FliF [Henriciella litoralis]|uniref:flagellar basal-body MS-ring/collar protein FliF n=1 Tax=Henriciella litoralis TaxID=568102 RepID=UPI0009FFBA9A|nr:flagellar basal-body MS-ring/collar protein FliF [Henriciella litoralis]
MKFLDTLRSLSLPRQIALAGAVVAVILAMSFMVRGAMSEPKALLYSGLDASHSGEIIEELDKRGIDYEIRGDAIFIAASKRDETRFALARQGLPQQSVQGYELLDDVNGFSVTSEMYNAAYWRAKEGELTRTILAIPGVQSARVHIGASLRSGFSRSSPAQTASVTLATTHDISGKQAEAIQYLVALAISGLAPEDVAVIDPAKGLIAGPNVDKTDEPDQVADSQSAMIEQKIRRLLDARVGPGNARVSVSVDVNRQRQTIFEKTIDPQSRVVRNRTSNDVSETNTGGAGELSAASNLPQGGANSGGDSRNMKNSTESVSYEFNERRVETEMMPGKIQRISVAVLLNEQVLGLQGTPEETAAEAQQIIDNFQQLILSGAGLDTARGDSLTVELMPFQEMPAQEMVEAPGMVSTLVQQYSWPAIQALLLGVVIIVLGLFVVRPMMSKGPDAADMLSEQKLIGNEVANSAEAADPFAYLSDYTRERQDETAALLQSWLDEDRKVAVNE